jgi:hypothetical protein
MGGPRRSVAQALSEAIDIIRASWAGQPFGYEGRYYQVPDLQPGPRPAHQIGIWLGVAGPRAVRLAGAKADGWSVSAPYVPPERLGEINAILTSSARGAGRDPGGLVQLYNVRRPPARIMGNRGRHRRPPGVRNHAHDSAQAPLTPGRGPRRGRPESGDPALPSWSADDRVSLAYHTP